MPGWDDRAGGGRDSKQREQPGHRHGAEQMLENLGCPQWVRTGMGGGGRRDLEADTFV